MEMLIFIIILLSNNKMNICSFHPVTPYMYIEIETPSGIDFQTVDFRTFDTFTDGMRPFLGFE